LLTEENENEIYAIKIENANFSWGADPTDPAKPQKEEKFISQENNDINIEIKKVEDKFQEEDAQNPESTLKIKNSNNIKDTAISELKKSLQSSDFKITENEQKENPKKIILKNINLEIKKGEIIGIIGEVSSGKSTLLQAILNNWYTVDDNISISIPCHTRTIIISNRWIILLWQPRSQRCGCSLPQLRGHPSLD